MPITDPRRRDGCTRVVKKKSKHYDEDSDIEILGIPGQQVSQHDRNHGMDDRTFLGTVTRLQEMRTKTNNPLICHPLYQSFQPMTFREE